ncbi:Zinc/iron permease [Neocallimastix californiae]|uniref:Zinc/iron permease n=1 Tax=Neocallimastix californiae TaxID=1754190 RepID=A0A1Y2E2G2_9FUNG|nr:Zinc/iron permease [Neocallimastix californiae]|eukprot:ORY65689.1 Zinc/iron permease [Neocallimastix californiae]
MVYPDYVTVLGIFVILLCSFLGTYLPMQFRYRSFFKEDTMLFRSIKLFGTGIILSIAFIHMIIPADHILTSEYSYSFFNEQYPSFTGVLVIFGIVITHFLQVYTSHIIYQNSGYQAHEEISGSETTLSVGGEEKNEMDITNEKIEWNDKPHGMRLEPTSIPMTSVTISNSNSNSNSNSSSSLDVCSENQHNLLYLMEHEEKQIVCYLLEIGISLHSILIGIAFGMTMDEELITLMVALMFHQFFEGVSLSSVFIEAHFRRSTAIFIMIITYSCTLPLGGFIGLFIRKMIESTNSLYLVVQGIIDAVAGGILIYDDVVNILSRHCNSKLFRHSSLSSKSIQLLAFYFGIITMAIVGMWA